MTRRAAPAEDVNLIPVMNLVTLLIPFLLMSAQFVAYAVIDTNLPAICSGDCSTSPDADPVSVRLHVTRSGYRLQASGPGLDDYADGVQLDCLTKHCSGTVEEAWNLVGLREHLTNIKDAHPEVRSLVLVPQEHVSYEAIVLALDATREDPDQGGMLGEGCNGRCLFPDVVVAGGVQP